jgi:hypothetical protein
MRLKTFVAVNVALMGMVAGAWGDTYNFLGSSTNSWVGYAGAPVPNLITAPPGSIVDAPSAGSSYGRLTNGFTAFPGSWRAGDRFTLHFDGVLSNNTALRIEFTDSAHVAALEFVVVNGAANNADMLQINALGGSFVTLFDNGNFGGAGGVGSAQRIIGNLTLTILSGGTTASLSGSVGDGLGNLWNGPNAFFAGVNLNAGAGVSGINSLDWAVTAVPEPNTAALFAGLGLAALVFGRRLRQKS